MRRFKEKTIIITGAGTDIGRATAIRFAKEGANVVLVGRTQESLEDTVKQLPQDNTWIHTDNYLTAICDISVQAQVEEMLRQSIKKFGTIDVVVNNAEQALPADISEPTADQLESAINTNLDGIAYVCQAAMPSLIETQGNIINVSSISGINGDCSLAAYDTVKTAISKLTRTLALAHGRDGVRANAINPSITGSNIASSQPASEDKSDNALHCSPLGRVASPEDIAAAITFLASNDAALITAVNLPVDGGVSAANE